MNLRHLLLLTVLLLPCPALAQATKAPARIALNDQLDKPQVISFPAKKVTVISIADRFGREQANQWAPVLDAWKDRVNIHGIADAKGTPGLMKESIRKRIAAAQTRTLLIDWTGTTSAALGAQVKVANLLIIAPDGTILHRTTGAPAEANTKAFNTALKRALAGKKPQR